MILPELKRLHSPDVPDICASEIDDSEPFCVLVQAMFGPQGKDGEESFDVLVCNPDWLRQKTNEGPVMGRHHLVVGTFDPIEIRAALANFASSCGGATWVEVAEKLGRIGKWEFEDYND